jgi:palmitoyltransferase
MDHHCPWTANCVSHTTFPHFLRFLFYAVTSMTYLSSFLWTRCAYLWNHRSMPSYLGPSMPQLALLFLLCVTNSMILFALTILLVRNIWCLAVNTTTIEGWEIERHETLVRRARYFGGYLEGPDGIQIPIRKQEFPYDIGIWKNCKQGMGTGNVLAWFWPLAATPPVATGISFETNGFEDASVSWPPPDPDRLQRSNIRQPGEAFTYRDAGLSDRETLIAFRKRQSEDLELRKRKPFLQRLEAQKAAGSLRRGEERVEETAEYGYGSDDAGEDGEREGEDMNGGKGLENVDEGEEAWRNSEGERLGDFGVDEDVEFYDEEEDDIPLSELLARRKARETGLTTKS